MWDTFYIHFAYINSDLQKVYIIKIMYIYNLRIKFIQNMYTSNCMENGYHTSTYFDLLLP